MNKPRMIYRANHWCCCDAARHIDENQIFMAIGHTQIEAYQRWCEMKEIHNHYLKQKRDAELGWLGRIFSRLAPGLYRKRQERIAAQD